MKTQLKAIIFILFYQCLFLPLYAQYEAVKSHYNILHFNHLKHDIANENMVVKCIYEDRNGFIWMVTETGICRFDGQQVYFFSNEKDESYGNLHNIRVFHQGAKGNIWMGGGNVLLTYDPQTEHFAKIRYRAGVPFLHDEQITTLFELHNELWVGTSRRLYHAEIKDSLQMSALDFSTSLQKEKMPITSMCQGLDGNLWVGTEHGGLYAVIRSKNRGGKYHLAPLNLEGLGSEGILYLTPYDSQHLLVATPKRLILINNQLELQTLLENNRITSVNVTSFGAIWCTTFGDGIFYFKTPASSVNNYQYYGYDNRTFNFINTAYIDSKDNFWIVPEKLGLRWLSNKSRYITNYAQSHFHEVLKNNIVKSVAVDRLQNWYIGTYNGISVYDGNKKCFRQIAFSKSSPLSEQVECSKFDAAGNLWIGTRNGLFRYSPVTGKTKSIPHLEHTTIWDVHFTSDGSGLWAGSDKGLLKIDFEDFRIKRYVHDSHRPKSLSDNSVLTVFEDSRHRIWAGTEKGGLNMAQRKKRDDELDFVRLGSDGGNGTFEASTVYAIHESYNQTIWIGTQVGAFIYTGGKTFKKVFGEPGHATNIIKGIAEDRQHRLWFTTHLGITVFDPGTHALRNFNTIDGMNGDIFNLDACRVTADNRLLAGSLNGLIVLDIDSLLKKIPEETPSYIQSIIINNREIKASEIFNGRVLTDRAPRYISELELKHGENNISIGFGTIAVNHPERVRWAYRISNIDKSWHCLPMGQNTVTLSNLHSGLYVMEYKSCDSFGVWNDKVKTISIRVLPHWSQTPWAYSIYALLFIGMIIYILKYQRRKISQKESLDRERILHRQTLKLEEDKLDFFTNISHELRTPITLIAAPLGELKNRRHTLSEEQQEYYIGLMHKNICLLNKQIEQLLNFRKVESGVAKLCLGDSDLPALLETVVDNFKVYAEHKQIDLIFENDSSIRNMVCDANALEIILCNLISNAIKYSVKESAVYIRLFAPTDVPGYYCISVTDDGIGMSEDQQQKIFQRFARLNNAEYKASGIGIGLAYVKALVDLHQGKIEVSSKLNEGSCFKVYLPSNLVADTVSSEMQQAYIGEVCEMKTCDFPHTEDAVLRETLLIVEDNTDLQSFLKSIFENDFKVLLAENGKEGLAQASKHLPDIIISDIMMPEMNGIEMTQKIKANLITSHIPVIMLTAKADRVHEMEGLEAGADYYLRKPFVTEQLELIVRNIHKHQVTMREYLSRECESGKHGVEKSDEVADKFLSEIKTYIIQHLDSPELNVDSLSNAMHVSTVQLYRKLKASADVTPNDLIRNMRMERGVRMLTKGDMNISEVAYAIGYNDPKYFSKCFKTVYGISPTAYIKSHKTES